MNLLLSASSPDGSLAVIKAPSTASSSRHLIQVYQVSDSSTTLQLTLTHTSQLPLIQLVFVGTTSVLGLFGREQIVVWDLNRGVVATTLSATEDQAFLALAAPSEGNDEKYYALARYGPKLVVQEYQSSNNKLVRKIKSGRFSGFDEGDDVDNDMTTEQGKKDAASLIVTSSHVVVHTKDSGIRIMDKDSGKKTGKIKIKASSSSAHLGDASSIEMSPCFGNSNIVVVSEDAGDAILYDLESCEEVARLPTDSTQQAGGQSCLQVIAQSKEDEFTLLRNCSLYSIVSGKKKSYEKLTQLSTNNAVAFFLKNNNKALALIHQRSSEYRVQWINLSLENEDDLPAVYNLDEQQKSNERNEATNTNKRKPSESKVLGPGQAGHESLASNVTIAERLQMLTDALDEEENEDDNDDDDKRVAFAIAGAAGKTKFKPLTATTESLKELLTQALQSSDDSLLELALSVHDVGIIATTIKQMNEDLLVILLGKLTSRLASSPLRAESLSVWISHCLKRGSFDSEHLAVLRNMLFERIESFSDLLRLEGRLSMMVD
ncbi:hypothetical protein FRACYDRAFT_232600 [Fragilariopsis cylindrus CCMP1102]|uniref:Small-subunit processome Utp12 domain-containing protein n=1 Tax=Fragilariopsis cylindrus CCMP1102 TaxID=635003 RepID=A0A1E7FWB1_9STRA|nr:hypothetical protein FRACYDRAFT_232600 [Fragilariopsis cylindrus CCMP1102]|eukprot:OEU22442.1 hypothetical protein FRACYDRAFT_232600 [Fragilariopsis cylindrus CCMP1102]